MDRTTAVCEEGNDRRGIAGGDTQRGRETPRVYQRVCWCACELGEPVTHKPAFWVIVASLQAPVVACIS